MNFVIEEYYKTIQHDRGYDKKHNKPIDGESSSVSAYQIDSGFSEALGFANGQLSQADYFLLKDSKVTIIELTRISDVIQEAFITEKKLEADIKKLREETRKDANKTQEALEKQLNKTLKKFSSQKVWGEIIGEFKNKWMGSIAILERYCRRIHAAEDFKYATFLIVFTNDIDSRLFESIEEKLRHLQGMGMQVIVCRTENIDNLLNKK